MFRRRHLLSLGLLAATLAACSGTTAPAEPRANVAVQAPSVVATTVTVAGVTWLEFTVPVLIANTGSVALTYSSCASWVEARAGDAWKAAYTPLCMLSADGDVVIPPGESLAFNVSVQASLSGPGGPPWLADPSATDFRFSAGLTAPGTSGRIPIVRSNVFTLVGR